MRLDFASRPTSVILASASPARARMLEAAGVDFTVLPADIDEAALRLTLQADNSPAPEDVAHGLAAAKALSVSANDPAALVIGADQVLDLDGEILAKPADIEAARSQLLALKDREHRLISAAVVAIGADVVWRAETTAHLRMRAFTRVFLDHYLERVGERAMTTVGAYEIEGPGIQLFDRVEGDNFTIQGLPLLDLLRFLRRAGALET